MTFENIVTKGEIAHNEQFLLLPQRFQLYLINIISFIENNVQSGVKPNKTNYQRHREIYLDKANDYNASAAVATMFSTLFIN